MATFGQATTEFKKSNNIKKRLLVDKKLTGNQILLISFCLLRVSGLESSPYFQTDDPLRLIKWAGQSGNPHH